MELKLYKTPAQELIEVWGHDADYEEDIGYNMYSLSVQDGTTIKVVNQIYTYHREYPLEIPMEQTVQASLYRSTALFDRLFGSKVLFIKFKYVGGPMGDLKHIYWSKDSGESWQTVKKMSKTIEKIHSLELTT